MNLVALNRLVEEKKNEENKDENKEVVCGYTVEALVRDEFLNSLRDQTVDFALFEGGSLKFTRQMQTDSHGEARVQLWDVKSDTTIKVSCQGLEPQTVKLAVQEEEK